MGGNKRQGSKDHSSLWFPKGFSYRVGRRGTCQPFGSSPCPIGEACPPARVWLWGEQKGGPALITFLSSLSLLFSLSFFTLPDCLSLSPPTFTPFSGSFQMTKFLFPKAASPKSPFCRDTILSQPSKGLSHSGPQGQ